MKISVTEAKAQLTELVRRAEAGDEVILTRHGQSIARLVGLKLMPDRKTRRELIDSVRRSAAAKGPDDGPSAARSQDYLYDENGLPK